MDGENCGRSSFYCWPKAAVLSRCCRARWGWRLVVLAGACLGLVGCSTPPKVKIWIDELEREVREKEDQIYELEDENERLCKEVEHLKSKLESSLPDNRFAPPRRETPSILPPRGDEKKQPLEVKPSDVTPPAVQGVEPPAKTPDPATPPSKTGERESADTPAGGGFKTPPSTRELPPRDLPPETPSTEPPAGSILKPSSKTPVGPTEIPDPAVPEKLRPAAPTPPSDELPAPSGSERKSPEPEAINPKVSHLRINPSQTGGYHVEGSNQDDGVRVLLEPRNEQDQFVRQPGQVTVVAIDPEEPAGSQKIARWHFEAEEVQELLAATAPQRGVMLHLPWSDGPPKHSHLKLFVRYIPLDGARCEAQQDLFVALPGQVSNRWTPSTSQIKLVQRESPLAADSTLLDKPAVPPAGTPTARSGASGSSDAPRKRVESSTTGAPGASPAPAAPLPEAERRPAWRPYR